ncbi:MAG: 23S rRNA (adenine(2030)-N(6))-methyltransferase RlmJ [Planctomycetes bacterium]|nr:23S rRNA (adenine(2030)-N(6))-methyltransferase RlmJ [Planctomycetota bacterium]
MRYPGGKNHVYQALINLIPEHDRWVEAFAGSAAVSRHLARRHAEAWVLELDQEQAARLRRELPGHRVLHADAFRFLREHAPSWGPETVVFVDPPYPLRDRRDGRRRYRHELTDAQHEELAELLHATRARVLVCGHPWGLYPRLYRSWHRHELAVVLRSGGPGVECVWTNYADPWPLHDYRYWGADKRVRQDLRRQVARHLARFGDMNRHVRTAVLRALTDAYSLGGDRRLDLDRQAASPAPARRRAPCTRAS